MQLIGRVEHIVLKGAQKEAEEILEEARERASSIIENVRKRVPQILSYYTKRAERWIELERQRRIGLAQLKINEAYLSAEHEILSRVFDGLEDEVKSRLKDENLYRQYLNTLVNEIFSRNSFDEPVVRVNPSDVEILSDILKKSGIEARVEPDPSVEYGIVVEDGERGFLVYNTLNTRLERVRRIVSEKIRKFWEE